MTIVTLVVEGSFLDCHDHGMRHTLSFRELESKTIWKP